MKKICLLLFVCFAGAVFPLRGEVFLLRPLGKNGGSVSDIPLCKVLPGLENASSLLAEPMKINGRDFTLEVFASSARFEDILRFLNAKGIRFAQSNDSLRCSSLLADGTVERIMVVKSPGRGAVTVFRIAGRGGLPPVQAWPRELPELPPGARALQVIELPKRNCVYGAFDCTGSDPAGNLRTLDAVLRNQGWQAAGKEASPLIGGTGDIYYHKLDRRVIWVTFDNSGAGAFCSRRL